MFSQFKINKLPSIYSNKTVLNEFIPDNRLNALIQHNIGVEFIEKDYRRKKLGFRNEMAYYNTLLGKYNKKENCFKIKLKNAPYNWGRVQPEDYSSLSVFRQKTRHSLCQDQYKDIDMKSCCQTIFLNLVRMNGISHNYPCLEEYVAQRDQLLAHYGEKYGVCKKTVKELFTSIGFCGSAKNWYAENSIEYDNDRFIKELNAEYYKLADIIYDANKNICEDILKALPNKFVDFVEPSDLLRKKKKTTMALFYQTAERYCQEAAISYLCDSKGFNLKDIVPCQDGFMILASLMYPTICEDCEKVIKNRFKIEIQFVEKEFSERFEIPKYISDKDRQLALKQELKEKKEAEAELKKQQKEEERQQKIQQKEAERQQKRNEIEATTLTIREEEQRQKEENDALMSKKEKELQEERKRRIDEFEENHIKIVNKAFYLKEVPDKTIVYTKKKLIDAYEHLKGIECLTPCGIIEKPFIAEWTEMNPTIRFKDDMGIYPPPLVCPDNIYNTWKPFAGQALLKKSGYVKNEIAIEKVRKHILILCNNDETVAKYFELWVAQMIQFPAIKSNCPILISKEGAGKGTLLDFLTAIIGVNKYFQTTKPELHIWGSFNSVMADCFLVNLNELSKKSTTDAMGVIKGLITDAILSINTKGITAYDIISYHRWIITTNSEDPMPTKKDDRRFWIVRSSDELIGNKEYFDEMRNILKDENAIASIFDYFATLEGAEDFNKLQRPLTEFQQNIQEANISAPERWLRDYVSDCGEEETTLSGKEIYQKFQAWKDTNGITFEVNAIKLGLALSNMNVDGIKKGQHTNKGATKIFEIKKIRKHFGVGCLI